MKKEFLLMAAIFFVSHLTAQNRSLQTADTIGNQLDEVVVTATKYPVKTSVTGKVLTVITREQIERSGGKDLSQLLTEQAGIYIGGANSNAGKDKSLYLRGGYIAHTLITLDGIPVYDPSGIGSNFDIRNLSLATIERIEILKGSQSTLYGSDAINGVINIITRKVGSKPLAGNTLLSYGSNETFRSNAALNGRHGKVDYNAAYALHTTAGINESVNTNNTSGADKDKFRQHSVQLGLGIQATNKINIQPYFRYNSINGDLDQGAFTDELDYTYTQKSWQAGLRNELLLGKAKLSLLYSFNSIDRVYIDDSTKSRNGYDTWVKGSYTGAEHFVDAYLNIPFSKQVKFTGGIDFRSSTSDQRYQSVGFFGPYETNYSSDSLAQNQIGFYSALNWNHPNGFNAEVGGRFNIHSLYGSNFVFNINPSYLINEKVKLFFNISTAFRTPSLYQLFSEYGNTNLKPERAATSEAGIQYLTPAKKFTARATFFARQVKDVIFFQSKYINQDIQKDSGLELDASYTFSKKTMIKVFYNYNTGQITTRKNNKDTTYNNLIRRPKSTFGLNIGSQLTNKFYLSTNLQGIGKRNDIYFDNNTFSNVHTVLKGYILWDVYAEYKLSKGKIKLFADFRNITNSQFIEISGFNTLGFNAYGGLRFNF
ncbi:MAG: hypothetical protein RIR12_1449 [Bacteroidota bacterium]|jgi:vitamin B12 transporter